MLSEILKKERETKRLSIDDLSLQTNIPSKYIVALEEFDFISLPAPVYVQGYLKKIAKNLDLNFKELWDLFLKELDQIKSPNVDLLPGNRFEKKVRPHYLVFNILKIAPFVIIGVTVLGFLFYQAHLLLGAPTLKIERPAFDLITQDASIIVEGYGRSNTYVTINGKEVYLPKGGHFSEEIYLNPGVNEIKIEAESRLGKKTTIIKQITKE
ncbi:MAG TPA: helix-turn-helix domain-containing protein [Candidatus Paceibacterota bacterium]|nr:helix-turn-helix domain-containing protein [Candidatus Paceibacterota bacterium]HPT40190.1 helix-turn-helix domain-containing protein [Candidatus Paceibacterota bacterium]